MPIHCGALPASLLESELFGCLKRSFTGAVRDQPGLVETTHRGTLLLDEVGDSEELPASAPTAGSTLADEVEQIERRMVADTLAASGGNQSEAARALDLLRVELIKKITRLGLR